jgi:hypothetical protein
MNTNEISVSQTFRVTNPDHNVLSETWAVAAVEYPVITFSVTRFWVRDIAYIPISSTDTVVGTVYQENEEGVFIKIIKPPSFDWAEVKVILQAEEATYIFD